MAEIRVHTEDTLTARLNDSSARRRFYPYDPTVVDWSIPLSDEYRYMPEGYSVLDGTPLATDLNQAEIAFVTRWEITSFFRNNHIGEHLLNQAILSILHKTNPYSPAYRYLLHEVAEECQHMAMFNSWVRLNGDIRTKGLGNHVWGLPVSVLTPVIATNAPALFWVLTFLFEVFGDDFARVSSRNPSGNLHPIVQQIGRVHMVEEARHIAFAEDWLAHQVPRMRRWQRAALSRAVEVVVATAIKAGFPVRYSRQIAPYVSYDAFRDALRSSHRRALIQRIYAPLVEDLRELGIVRPRAVKLWRKTGILTARTAA